MLLIVGLGPDDLFNRIYSTKSIAIVWLVGSIDDLMQPSRTAWNQTADSVEQKRSLNCKEIWPVSGFKTLALLNFFDAKIQQCSSLKYIGKQKTCKPILLNLWIFHFGQSLLSLPISRLFRHFSKTFGWISVEALPWCAQCDIRPFKSSNSRSTVEKTLKLN